MCDKAATDLDGTFNRAKPVHFFVEIRPRNLNNGTGSAPCRQLFDNLAKRILGQFQIALENSFGACLSVFDRWTGPEFSNTFGGQIPKTTGELRFRMFVTCELITRYVMV